VGISTKTQLQFGRYVYKAEDRGFQGTGKTSVGGAAQPRKASRLHLGGLELTPHKQSEIPRHDIHLICILVSGLVNH
jgi:hypothetical protein